MDHTATGTNDGSSWANAFTDMQSAMAVGANSFIHVAKGTYLPTSTGSRGAAFNVPENCTILGGYPNGGGTRNADANVTRLSGEVDGISGSAGNSYHVVKVVNKTCVVIDGITISWGNADDPGSFGRSRGGGIYVIGSEVSLLHVNFTWNKALYGGAMFAYTSPNVIIENCLYKNNTADYGSAIYHSNQTQMFIRYTRIIDNTSNVRCAIEVNNSLFTRLENSLIANNASTNANGIALIATNRDQTIEVFNTTILGETKDRFLVTMQVGFGDQLDAYFYNSIIGHQSLNYQKAFKQYNNGINNLHTENCYIQGSSVFGTAINNLYSNTAGSLMLNPDYSVDPCSPVVDAGNNAYAPLPIDIDGNNRIYGQLVDMGAFESQMGCTRMAGETEQSFVKETDVEVFPNPTNGYLQIRALEQNVTIRVFDVLGNLVLDTQEKEINISDYPAGVYILNVSQEGKILTTTKVVKK